MVSMILKDSAKRIFMFFEILFKFLKIYIEIKNKIKPVPFSGF
jgi:hypothetical protein